MANSEIAFELENAEKKAPEATLLAENPKERVTSNSPHSNSKDVEEKSAMEDDHESSSIWSTTARKNSKEDYWKKIFAVSCFCGATVDPLFLYVPILKDDIKCLLLDQKLKIATLSLRLVIDLFYLLDIIFRIYISENYSGFIKQLHKADGSQRSSIIRNFCVPTIAKAIWGSNYILIDILAILPPSLVAVLIFFSNMGDLGSLTTRMMFIISLFALSHYVLRLLRIFLSCKELFMTPDTPTWIKATLNFFLYINAGHVFGASWYFFAIKRMMDCWHFACRKEDGCDITTFGCHDHHTFRNITILNDLCPINPSDAKMFDFGIFTRVLESGIIGSTNYFQKFSNCFWWGLRNLSSFGSNLEPSINGWENVLTASISIIGLLLFLCLIGNLQMYMQLEIAKLEERTPELRMKRKRKTMEEHIDLWLFKNGIPTRWHREMKWQVMEKIPAIEENMDVNLDNILHTLPLDFQSRIKNRTPLTKLKQVFEGLDEIVLKEICQHLKPKKFKNNDIIMKHGVSRKMMVFIVDGLVLIEDLSFKDGNHRDLRAGAFCGVNLFLGLNKYQETRFKRQSAKAISDVEALFITKKEVDGLYSRFEDLIDLYFRRVQTLQLPDIVWNCCAF